MDTALVLSYILGLVFVTCMFLCMATEWDLQSMLFFCCGGFAVIAMGASVVLRDAFEKVFVDRMHAFEPGALQQHYTQLPVRSLMPRLSVVDFAHAASRR